MTKTVPSTGSKAAAPGKVVSVSITNAVATITTRPIRAVQDFRLFDLSAGKNTVSAPAPNSQARTGVEKYAMAGSDPVYKMLSRNEMTLTASRTRNILFR